MKEKLKDFFSKDYNITILVMIFIVAPLCILIIMQYKLNIEVCQNGTPIDCRFTPAHDEVVNRTIMIHTGNSYIPINRKETIHHPNKYELLYHLEKNNGKIYEKWLEVSEEEYMNYLNQKENILKNENYLK